MENTINGDFKNSKQCKLMQQRIEQLEKQLAELKKENAKLREYIKLVNEKNRANEEKTNDTLEVAKDN